MTATDTTRALTDAIETVRPRVGFALPDPEMVAEIMRQCVNRTSGAWRKTSPKGHREADLVWRLVKWHQGGGSLWGLPQEVMLRREEDVWVDECESLAQITVMLLMGRMPAMDAWSRALGGRR